MTSITLKKIILFNKLICIKILLKHSCLSNKNENETKKIAEAFLHKQFLYEIVAT